MHGGFSTLRDTAPMNLRGSHPAKVPLDPIARELRRIEEIWGDLTAESGGPFLFGKFTAADAMFAPVATRIRTYALPVSDAAMEYVEAIYGLPAFQEWLAAARAEPRKVVFKRLRMCGSPVRCRHGPSVALSEGTTSPGAGFFPRG